MRKCKNEAEAVVVAEREGLSIGMSVFDGLYYAGHDTELLAIGCIHIRNPYPLSYDPEEDTQ